MGYADVPVPGIVFDNRTPYTALQFDALDQHGAAFHVFVAKIGYQINPRGSDGLSTMTPLDEVVELNSEDIHVDGKSDASVLEESDLAPFKPRCDVIINATAHAPKGNPVEQFVVGLSVETPGRASPSRSSELLIKKSLVVCGTRRFKYKSKAVRMLQWPLGILTLGAIRPGSWRLSSPQKLSSLRLIYEYAYGGQCRIGREERGAKYVSARNRLPASDDFPQPDIAHEASQSNPVGLGFTRNWYLKALRCKSLPAPQVSYLSQPITARQFQACLNDGPDPVPAGMGPVGRAWQPRRALIGDIKEKSEWGPDEVPALPEDFDFGYWNCAPADQQCPYLKGEERFTLINLCTPDHPAATVDGNGSTVLRFDLPRQAMFILAANASTQLTVLPLVIDTVIVSPETRRVDLVWRGCLAADPSLVESRLMHITDNAQIERLELLIQQQSSELDDTATLGKK